MKIQNFTDLDAWKHAHKLFILIYKLTKEFPKSELFGFTSQLRRAALSISSNIAEGFGRQSPKEKIQFYFIYLGSVLEVQNQIIAARDVGLINSEEFNSAWNQTVTTQKVINGLIRSIRSSMP